VLPCILAIPLLPPCVDALIAAVWILAASWHARPVDAASARAQPLSWLLIALGCLLAFFQGVLRPGADFF